METARVERVVRLLAAGAGIIGAAVLAGWLLDIALLKSLAPGLATMKANTALGFLISGTAIACIRPTPAPAARIPAFFLALAVFLLGSLTLCQYAFGFDLGIDQLLFRDPASPVFPGRMAPMTAIGFSLVGAALFGSALFGSAWRPWNQAAAVLLLMLSMIPLLGYAYDIDSLYRMEPYTSMALHTAVSFHLLALALLFRHPDSGLPAVFLSASAGGFTARRLIPIIPASIFILGLSTQWAARRGWFDPYFAVAILAVLCIFLAAGIVLWHAERLHEIDLARTRNEEQVRKLNEDLERKVKERTQQLVDSLAHVRQLQGLLPVCSWCKKIRDDRNYWKTIEDYLTEHTDARITHGICPECFQANIPKVETKPESKPSIIN